MKGLSTSLIENKKEIKIECSMYWLKDNIIKYQIIQIHAGKSISSLEV